MADRDAISALATHPSWPALRAHCQELMEAQFNRLARDMMSGKNIPPERIAYLRGVFAGMKILLDDPLIQARTIERSIAEDNPTVRSTTRV